jgi:hypothetical protein
MVEELTPSLASKLYLTRMETKMSRRHLPIATHRVVTTHFRHSELPYKHGGWHLPRACNLNVPQTTTPKSTLELCKQMKTKVRVPGAAGFIGHMENDNGDAASPFVKVAFAGTLGLGAEGRETALDQLGDYPLPITGISPSQVLQQARDWVEAMGGKFRLPEDCGCIEMHYALRVLAHGVLDMPGFTWNVRFSGIGTSFPEIPLKFLNDGTFSGEVMATPETDNQGALPMVTCSGERASQIKVVVKGSWADITPASNTPPTIHPRHPRIRSRQRSPSAKLRPKLVKLAAHL